MPAEREPSGKLARERGQLSGLETGGASGPLSDRKDYRRPAGKGIFSLLSAAYENDTQVDGASKQPRHPVSWGIQVAGGSLFLIQSEERRARFLQLLGGPVVPPKRLRVRVPRLHH